MKRFVKIGIVLGGYVAAFIAAWAMEAVHESLTSGDDRQASAGMYAFGDMVLFVWAFGGLSLAPTALALYFLRPYRKFWTAFSALALAVAATGPMAALVFAVDSAVGLHGGIWDIVGPLGLLRILWGTPVLVMGFCVCAAIAPTGRSRWALLAAAGIECAVGVYFAVHLFASHWS